MADADLHSRLPLIEALALDPGPEGVGAVSEGGDAIHAAYCRASVYGMSSAIFRMRRGHVYGGSCRLKFPMKAHVLLRNNIATLLAARKETQTALSDYCDNHKTWCSQFLSGKRDEIQLEDIDKIADFFGIANYQLMQPGISRLTERRLGIERREGQERRVGAQGRQLASFRAEHTKLPHGGAAIGASASNDSRMQRALVRFHREISALLPGEQAPTTRAPRAVVPRRDRKVRGSSAAEPK